MIFRKIRCHYLLQILEIYNPVTSIDLRTDSSGDLHDYAHFPSISSSNCIHIKDRAISPVSKNRNVRVLLRLREYSFYSSYINIKQNVKKEKIRHYKEVNVKSIQHIEFESYM